MWRRRRRQQQWAFVCLRPTLRSTGYKLLQQYQPSRFPPPLPFPILQLQQTLQMQHSRAISLQGCVSTLTHLRLVLQVRQGTTLCAFAYCFFSLVRSCLRCFGTGIPFADEQTEQQIARSRVRKSRIFLAAAAGTKAHILQNIHFSDILISPPLSYWALSNKRCLTEACQWIVWRGCCRWIGWWRVAVAYDHIWTGVSTFQSEKEKKVWFQEKIERQRWTQSARKEASERAQISVPLTAADSAGMAVSVLGGHLRRGCYSRNMCE